MKKIRNQGYDAIERIEKIGIKGENDIRAILKMVRK